MENKQYADFYVSKKSILFPLMQKYTGKSYKGATHGEAAGDYVQLLGTNMAFKKEVDDLISSGHNAAGVTPAGGIIGAVGNLVNTWISGKQAKTEQDTVLYQAVLESQGKSDTNKILIVSGVALLFVVVAVIVVVKTKKV